jgi:HSP20 family protein
MMSANQEGGNPMFRLTRFSPYDELFTFQREVDRLFNQFWSDLPARTAAAPATQFQATSTEDGWRIDVPMPGVDPAHVSLEAAGNTLNIRAEEPGDEKTSGRQLFEQTLTVPPFLDLEKIAATHRHGMLQLTIPMKESVKPRRIQIAVSDAQPQLVGSGK